MENENKDLLIQLAKRVKELRSLKGVSQEAAFTDTGIHFGRIEQGKRDISLSTLKNICDYFELSMSEFLSTLD